MFQCALQINLLRKMFRFFNSECRHRIANVNPTIYDDADGLNKQLCKFSVKGIYDIIPFNYNKFCIVNFANLFVV